MRIFLTLLAALALNAGAASWYVNPDAAGAANGTSWANGWTNFATVVWGASGVTAGDTLYISGGESGRVYTAPLTTGAAGTSNAPITIKIGQDVGHAGAVTISNYVTIGHDYVTLNGGKAPDAEWPTGVPFTTANLLQFLNTNINLTVINVSNSCVQMTQNEGLKLQWVRTLFASIANITIDKNHGIEFSASDSGVIVRNSEISYCLSQSNAYDGINFTSNSATNWDSVVIKYCACLDNGDDNLQGADGMTIHHCWFEGRYDGAMVGHADTVQAVGDYFNFHHNYCYGIWNSWIKFEYGYSSIGASDIGKWRIYNNVFGANGDWVSGGDGGVVFNGQLNTSSLKTPFTMPAKDGGTVTVTVGTTSQYYVGQILMLKAGIFPSQQTNFGAFELTAKSGLSATIKNLETTSGDFSANVEPGTTIGTNWVNDLGQTQYLWFHTYMPALKIPEVYVLNNTFYNGKSSSMSLSGKAMELLAGITNGLVANNIIHDGALSSASGVLNLNDSYNTLTYDTNDLVVDYNVVSGRARIMRYQTNWYNDINLMSAAKGFAHNSTNIPAFVDYNNWNLSLSTNDTVALGQGEDLSALGFEDIDKDITGAARIGAWSIGAYQGQADSRAPSAPVLKFNPRDVTIVTNATATFTVSSEGTFPMSYQWYSNNVPVGTSANSFTTGANRTAGANEIYVVMANSVGSVTSRVAALTVVDGTSEPPTITGHPQSASVTEGAAANFTVTATGTAPFTYQWYWKGGEVGASSSSYTTPATTLLDDGSEVYAIVNNSLGSATSSVAVLSVSAAPEPPSNGTGGLRIGTARIGTLIIR